VPIRNTKRSAPQQRLRAFVLVVLGLTWAACHGTSVHPPRIDASERLRLVFKYQPLGPDPTPMQGLLADFERAHPDVAVATEQLPNDSDTAHQYFLTALEAGADFDVFVVDVIWVQEFARAGWIADLSYAIPSEAIRNDFVSGAAEAVLLNDHVFAVPWYADVGLLYYRSDLVPRPPKTYSELERFAADARRKDPTLQGYVWQGRQYEGLVCNVYEVIWGHEGLTGNEQLRINTGPARAALGYLHSLVQKHVSPDSVKSAAEEDSRRVFQSGRAVFMRNWPYAWAEAQRPDSIVRGKIGVAPLPTLSGEKGHGALGGWQLAVNSRAAPRNRAAAIKLIEYLTSPASNRALALAYGRNPPRRDLYQESEFAERAPAIVALYPMLESARPRPVTPYYNLLSDTLQSEFSAAIVGIRAPEKALERAQQQINRITGQTW
jgi:multiple sugar transport system substrate-binding protein